ncbi:MAG: hypothetical protein WD335_02580 [Candidatus Paceibacterota bacterium]
MASISDSRVSDVRKLYYDESLSMQEIADNFGVSLDAVCYFMRKNGLERRNASQANRVRFDSRDSSFILKDQLSTAEEKLKVAGIMLYWAEGAKYKKGRTVDFANSDVAMICLFLDFLRTICGIDESKLRILLYCYANHDVGKLKRFWSQKTDVDLEQFIKPYVREDYDIEKIDRMPHGLIHVRYHDKKLLTLLKKWISEYK